MNHPVSIYEINSAHLKELRTIAIRTFEETFAATNSRENMDHYYAMRFNARLLTEELQHPESWWYFIEFQGKLAGYLKVNVGQAQTELQEEEGFEVERIYVLKAFHGSGVGAALMEQAIRLGREKGKKYLWLGVHEENYRALRFYGKFGLQEFDDHVFMMGKQPQRDLLMRMEL
ncbi:MAG: GNAT family N-acetyltransferase [Bacteroidales bacterium]|nr:GNAT family N-acetyltransferase [Bacteroidales bacterium]MDT8431003.1 GNAT family N-acetyltransferase [Bacteroidales bacterium]